MVYFVRVMYGFVSFFQGGGRGRNLKFKAESFAHERSDDVISLVFSFTEMFYGWHVEISRNLHHFNHEKTSTCLVALCTFTTTLN